MRRCPMMNVEQIPEIKWRPKKNKIVDVVLFIIDEWNRSRNRPPSQYDIVKTIFLADRAHLNRFGRPITFDNYTAMEHGPVPSYAYDMLKPKFNWPSELGMVECPWLAEREGNAYRFRETKRSPDVKSLSKSDIDALSDAMKTVGSLSFGQIRRLTHEDPAYRQAWGKGGSLAVPMLYALLFDEPDEEAVEELAHVAEMQ